MSFEDDLRKAGAAAREKRDKDEKAVAAVEDAWRSVREAKVKPLLESSAAEIKNHPFMEARTETGSKGRGRDDISLVVSKYRTGEGLSGGRMSTWTKSLNFTLFAAEGRVAVTSTMKDHREEPPSFAQREWDTADFGLLVIEFVSAVLSQ